MKKTIAILFVVLLCFGLFAESIDLSKMSFEELVQLREQINIAIWNSKEWQEVTVPAGVWEVGKDIPAGHWTVKLSNQEQSYSQFSWGDYLDDSKTEVAYKGKYDHVLIQGAKSRIYKDGDLIEYSFEIVEGQWIVIDDKSVIFTPYIGKTSFGFK